MNAALEGRDCSPKVSVLMTVYNDERHVAHAIESILSQTFKDFELIIINDGSTDGTLNVLNRYASNDNRINVLNQENCGTTISANNGVNAARGEYIARIDSDDISYPNRLAVEVLNLDANPQVGLVGGGAHIADESGQIIGMRNIFAKDPKRVLQSRCIFQQSDVMFRKSVFLAVGGYRNKFWNAQDYDLWLRMSEVSGIRKLNEILGQWRLNRGGYTLARMHEQKSEVKKLKEFARQRREYGYDEYETYDAPTRREHRKAIQDWQYDLYVVLILLQGKRIAEARRLILKILSEQKRTSVLLVLCFSWLPGVIINLAFRARELYLNHR